MLIDVRDEGEVVVIQPAGRLDVRDAGVFRRHLTTLVNNGRHQVVVDLSQVEFIDSAGLAALVSGLKLVRANDGELRLAGPQDPVRLVFEITRLHCTFDIHEDSADAVEAMLRDAEGRRAKAEARQAA